RAWRQHDARPARQFVQTRADLLSGSPFRGATGLGDRMNRPIKNLSIRIRRKVRLDELAIADLKQRKTVDYSASGLPVSVEPPITVQHDALLKRLKEGNR